MRTPYTYRQCTITATRTRSGLTGRRVYAVSGRYSHPVGPRPFLTTLAAAREWIDRQDEDAALAATLDTPTPRDVEDRLLEMRAWTD